MWLEKCVLDTINVVTKILVDTINVCGLQHMLCTHFLLKQKYPTHLFEHYIEHVQYNSVLCHIWTN